MDRPSVWQKVAIPPVPTAEPAAGRVQALVIGGGLCGLLTALRLTEKGLRSVALIEAEELCSGTSARTTDKITAQHGWIYDRLLQGMGREKAWQYAQANQDAVDAYADLVERYGISCDFRRAEAVLYTTQTDGVSQLERERDACLRLGLPVRMEHQTELPFPVAGSLWLPGQAMCHPRKLAAGLVNQLLEQGVRLYPHTRAIRPPDGWRDGVVMTDRGTIEADAVVVTTHFPFMDKPGFYFARMWQERSYILELEGTPPLHHMYKGLEKREPSFRPYGEHLLLSGSGHKTGHEGGRSHYEELEAASGVWYPDRRVTASWSAQDCMTHDGIPYIGRYRQIEGTLSPRVYVATGFNKWGMSSSMVAAEILSDEITGRENETASVFSPSRLDVGMKTRSFLVETADMLAHYIGGYVELGSETTKPLPVGEGRLMTVEGKRVGAYKAEDGTVYTINPICTHMGCVLEWNADEKSWDCPCHGSRYDPTGRLLSGPALDPLRRGAPSQLHQPEERHSNRLGE